MKCFIDANKKKAYIIDDSGKKKNLSISKFGIKVLLCLASNNTTFYYQLYRFTKDNNKKRILTAVMLLVIQGFDIEINLDTFKLNTAVWIY